MEGEQLSGIVYVVIIFLVLAGGLGGFAYLTYRKKLRRAKAIERGLKMVPILIHLPPPSSDTTSSGRDVREVMREKTAQAEVLYNLIAGTATEGFKSQFYGQRHIGLEIVASQGLIHYFVAVPVALVSVVEKAIQTAYPGARLEEVEDHNIFNQQGRLAATMGGEMVLRSDSAYPVATYAELERDPMEAILTTLSGIGKDDGAAIQIMVRPAGNDWIKASTKLAAHLRKGKPAGLGFTPKDLIMAFSKAPQSHGAPAGGAPTPAQLSNLEQAAIERVEEKTKHPGFQVLTRVIVSTESVAKSQQLLRDIATAFALFERPGLNGFKFLPAVDVQGIVTAFIFRFFPPEITSNILNSVELATLFHLPDAQFIPTANVERQQSKQVDGPVSMPSSGLLFGFNQFRGVSKEIRLSVDDRRRHTYILGQTGTGKSVMLENLVYQDMINGNGFAFIDPHGGSAEKLLSMVPKERAEDVIYFDPAETEYPMGFNLFEFTDPAQKDFIIQESINMLIKIYDPGGTGVIGPRFEQWFRNAALTLMSDPEGSTFIEIPKVFTDTEYLKRKFRYLKDPTVIEFWTKEMGQTSDYHKSEMLGYFVSKFGAFQQNEIMRNVMGQTKSAFNLRDVMDKKKILIVNLSKGRLGELNSQLLGIMFVIKFQAAAMSRADMPEADRNDFSLYVDEFQNFSTDSFASILSEARKYRLNLIVANQFIGQLSPEIRDAVFGNVGTIVAHRMGPEDAEFMVKQFAPVFDASDLTNIPNLQSVMRLMVGGLPSQPFTMNDLPPLNASNVELGAAIKQLSAAKFGVSKATVEADIAARLSGTAPIVVAPAAVAAPAPAAEPAPAPVAPAAPAVAATVVPAEPVAPAAVVPAPAPVPAQPVIAAAEPAVAPATPVAVVAPVVAPTEPVALVPEAAAALPAEAPANADPSRLSISDIARSGARTEAPAQDAQPVPAADPLASVPLLTPMQPEPVAAAISTEQQQPEPAIVPEDVAPASVDAPASLPAVSDNQAVPAAEPAPAESLVSFVDPAAEALLAADVPAASVSNEPSATAAIPTDNGQQAEQPSDSLITFVTPEPVSAEVAPSVEPAVAAAELPPLPPLAAEVASSAQPAVMADVSPAPVVATPSTANEVAPEVSVGSPTPAAALPIMPAELAPEPIAASTIAPSAASITNHSENTVAESTPAPSTSTFIERAEEQIDDLLTTSLIPHSTATQSLPPVSDDVAPADDNKRRWVGPAMPAEPSNDEGAEQNVLLDGGTEPAPSQDTAGSPLQVSAHKVIEPLTPIVSTPAIIGLENADQAVAAQIPTVPADPNPVTIAEPETALTTADPPEVPAAVMPELPALDVALPQPAEVVLPELAATEQAAPVTEALPELEQLDVAASEAASPDVVSASPIEAAAEQPVVEPVAAAVDDDVMPVAESLAAPLPEAPVGPEMPAPVDPQPIEAAAAPSADEVTVQTPVAETAEPAEAEAEAPEQSKRKRGHRGRGGKQENGDGTEPLAGKLILPTAVNADTTATATVVAGERPVKLAKGEVYVDANGNVTVGE